MPGALIGPEIAMARRRNGGGEHLTAGILTDITAAGRW